MYYLLNRPLEAALADNPLQRIHLQPEPITSHAGFRERICVFSDTPARPTGLTDGPKALHTLVFSHTPRQRSHPIKVLFDKAQCADYLTPLTQVECGQTWITETPLRATNNSFNQPQGVDIPAGTELKADWSEGTNRGHYFFDVNGQRLHINAFYVPHPYGRPILPPNVAKLKTNIDT